jgi:hypothetical protein
MSNPVLLNGVQESILFNSSAASDVQCSNGVLTIAGMSGTKKSNIISMTQVKYRAEVAQVVSVGATSYTPTADTLYTIEIGDTNRTVNGAQEQLKRYSYRTPPVITTLGATAALQREAIHLELVDLINEDTRNYVTAASLLLGTGISITDDAGYYPVNAQGMTNRLGASTVRPCTNPDGTGFAATNYSVTTAAVYSFGVGADLAEWAPVKDQMWGNLISGYLGGVAPKTAAGATATSGQKYDGFAIVSLTTASAHNQRGQFAYVPKVQIAYVDNGTGSSTANATGFAAFERAMQEEIASLYASDPSTVATFFDTPPTYASTTVSATSLPAVNGVPTGATGDINAVRFDDASLNYAILGAGQTKIVPTWGASGLTLDLDAADNEGAEYSAMIATNSNKQFVVGKQEFSLIVKGSIADVSDTDDCAFGFRKKEAYQANIDDYDEMAVLNVIAGDIKIETILNNGATTTTDTTLNWADAETHELELRVDINGLVRFYVDSVDKTSVQASNFSFDAGEVVIPFAYVLNAAASPPDVIISKFVALPSNTWKQ